MFIISISSSHNIGGEEKADYPAEVREGRGIGPGIAFKQAFGEEAEIIATIICGDSYFNENLDKAKAEMSCNGKEKESGRVRGRSCI